MDFMSRIRKVFRCETSNRMQQIANEMNKLNAEVKIMAGDCHRPWITAITIESLQNCLNRVNKFCIMACKCV